MKKKKIIISLVLAVLVAAGIVYFGLKNNIFADTNSAPQPAETFDSPNAIYDGDFEDSTPSGWASNNMVQSIYSPLGWYSPNLSGLTRDAHAGKFAYAASTFNNKLDQKLNFNPAGLTFTLGGWMKGNSGVNAAKNGQITLFYLTADGARHSLIIKSGQDGQPALTDQYQKYEKTFTFPADMATFDIKENQFQIAPNGNRFRVYLYGANGVAGNPAGSSLYFDDLALIFPTHPIVKQTKLTTNPAHSFVPDSPSSNKILCPSAKATVDFTYPNCFTKPDELSAVYVRLTALSGSPNLGFQMSGKMNNYYIPARYLSLFPGHLLSSSKNSDIDLVADSASASTSWFKLSYPYIYLNALDDSSEAAKATTGKSLLLFKAMNNGAEAPTAKFKIEVASDAEGTNVIKNKTIDGNSSEIIFIPRHLPSSGVGITFANEEANLEAQMAALNLDASTNQASKLTEVPFFTGNALGKGILDSAFYNLQTIFLRKLGISGLNLSQIKGPQSKTEQQSETQSQGFTDNANASHLNGSELYKFGYVYSQFDFPLDQSKIDKTIQTFKDNYVGYDADKIKTDFIWEEPSPKPIADYVNSPVAQTSFKRYLESLGLKPQDFDASFTSWDPVIMILPENASANATSSKEWFYTAKFRGESITRFSSAVSDGLKQIAPNASLTAGFSDTYQSNGNAMRFGTFWPSYARNSKIDSMPTGFTLNSAPSTMVSSYFSAVMRSGLTQNNFDLTALIMSSSSWTPDDMRLQIYSSLLSGAKKYWFFNYGPSYLINSDSSSTKTDKMRVINEVANDFVPVQSEIKNSTREKSQTAILYSETADIWQWANDNKAKISSNSALDREREGLFLALENKQITTDVVSEENIDLDNVLSQYKVLYLVGANIPASTQTKIAAWVKNGGTLYASMGAGSKDEFNNDSKTISDILGVDFGHVNIATYLNLAVPGASCSKGVALSSLKNYKIFTYGADNLYGQCMQMDPIKPMDSSTQVLAQGKSTLVTAGKAGNISSTSEPLLTRHQFGSGIAYYSNFLAGVSYEYKAAVEWRKDHPIKDSKGKDIIDPATGKAAAYPQSSFTKYPGDAEQNLIIAPFVSSGLIRKVEITDATTNELVKQIQTSVLSGNIANKAYSLIPIANFNQQDKTVKIQINVDPVTVLKVTSVEKGDLPFTKGAGSISLTSPLTVGLTDILKIELTSSQVCPLLSSSPSPSCIKSTTSDGCPIWSCPPSTPTTSYSFPKGFSTLGVTKSTPAMPLTSQGLYVYKFDGVNNKWLVTPQDSFALEPSTGYYIYNPSDTKTISLPFTAVTNSYILTKGWNMLHSSSDKQRSAIKLSLNTQLNTIDELINQNKINSKVFIVDNEHSSNPCFYFSLLDVSDQIVNCAKNSLKKQKTIPAGKAFWVYVK